MTETSLLKSSGLLLRNSHGYWDSQVHQPIHDTNWPLERQARFRRLRRAGAWRFSARRSGIARHRAWSL